MLPQASSCPDDVNKREEKMRKKKDQVECMIGKNESQKESMNE
jgi:hypothetical protein